MLILSRQSPRRQREDYPSSRGELPLFRTFASSLTGWRNSAVEFTEQRNSPSLVTPERGRLAACSVPSKTRSHDSIVHPASSLARIAKARIEADPGRLSRVFVCAVLEDEASKLRSASVSGLVTDAIEM